MEKYKILADETILVNGHTLFRIEAIKDFCDVKKGDKGGWVETYDNLSQEGCCWVYENAQVYDYACIGDDAMVCDNAQICGNVQVCGNAIVCNNDILIEK